MFTNNDIYFVLNKELQQKIFYKNKTFYGYDSDIDKNSFCKLDDFYNTDYVCMSKISYHLRKHFKNLNFETLKNIFIVLNFIETCEIFNFKNGVKVDYKSLLNKKSFPNYNIEKIYKIFIENTSVNEILLKLIYSRNK